jgi:hypothetical protein
MNYLLIWKMRKSKKQQKNRLLIRESLVRAQPGELENEALMN